MSKQYPKTKAELFSAYSFHQFEVPYISVGDVKRAFNDWIESEEYKPSIHKYRCGRYGIETREYTGLGYYTPE